MIVFLPELQNINLICQDARCRMKQIHLTKKKTTSKENILDYKLTGN